jgi:hypothetical protein
MRRRLPIFLISMLVVLAGLPRPVAAQEVTVVVDGTAVRFDQPPAMIGGRVLIPLRGVFEQLGASVQWDAAARLITAHRGATTIVLQPGNPSARVDGRVVALDVPAVIAGGRTLVPLRFVSEALGAAVNWDGATRVVYVSSPGAAAPRAPVAPQAPPVPPMPVAPPEPPPPVIVIPPPAPTPAPPPPIIIVPPPAPPRPSQVEGTVIRVETSSPSPRIIVRADGVLHAIAVSAFTSVFITDVGTGRAGAAAVDQIRRGDLVTVLVDAQGYATSIRASFRERSGTLDWITGRTVRLRDGQITPLGDDPVYLLDGREVPRDALRQGMPVVLRVNPATGEAWEVRAWSGSGPPPIFLDRPQIDSVSLNGTGPYGAGATLVMTMRGTPGGEARYTISQIGATGSMQEGPAGVYTARRPIRDGDAATQATITVRLRVRGVEISRDADTVIIDGLRPEITRVTPEPNSAIADDRPTISIGYADRGPAGIDRGSVRLWVNGQEVRRLTVTERTATYEPLSPLSAGRVRVEARVADRAGNEARTTWIFTIERASPPVPPAPPATPVPPAPPVRPVPPGVSPSPSPRLLPPEILAPRQGDTIGADLRIRGRAAPGLQVEVQVQIFTPPGGPIQVVRADPATAAGSGEWEVRIRLQRPLPRGSRLTITAVAIGPTGARSQPAQAVISVVTDPDR